MGDAEGAPLTLMVVCSVDMMPDLGMDRGETDRWRGFGI